MRLMELGLLLIVLAVILPILLIVSSLPTTGGNVAGVVVIFPIPIAIAFGNESLVRPLIWLAYGLFLALLALFIILVVRGRSVPRT